MDMIDVGEEKVREKVMVIRMGEWELWLWGWSNR